MTSAVKLLPVAAWERPIAETDILCVLPVRDEALRLPAMLDHHRRLGVDLFAVIDNGSTDGTMDYLSAQPDVRLYATEGSYAESRFGLAWLHLVLDEIADSHWVLILDADELFAYPHVEEIDLRRFCSYLDRIGHEAVFAILLDMYSDKSIAATTYVAGASLTGACPFFDPGPYEVVRDATFPTLELRGGPRRRVFWRPDTPFFPPTVSKVPLVKWRRGYRYVSSTHYMRPGPAKLPNVTGALLHFKFLSDFHERAMREAARGEHFDGAREYKMYLQCLEHDAALTLHYENSQRYQGSEQLVRCGLMRTSDNFERFVREMR
jgi:hypothetical protein